MALASVGFSMPGKAAPAAPAAPAAAAAAPKPDLSSPAFSAAIAARRQLLNAHAQAAATFAPIPPLQPQAGNPALAIAVALVLPIAKKSAPSPAPRQSPAPSTVKIGGGDELDEESAFSFLPPSTIADETHRTPSPPPLVTPPPPAATPVPAPAAPALVSAAAAAAAAPSVGAKRKPAGVLGTPCLYHFPDYFDKPLKNKELKSFLGKKLHTIVLTPNFRGDITDIRQNKVEPDENGTFEVPTKRRKYEAHEKPNPKTGINKLYPVSGPDMITFTGQELVSHIKTYRASHFTTFRDYLSQFNQNAVPIPAVAPAPAAAAAAAHP